MKQNKQLRLIVKDMTPTIKKDFPVKIRCLENPLQMQLFDSTGIASRAHIMMGRFYELFSVCLYGGRLADSYFLNNGNGTMEIKPDVINPKTKIMVESKAIRSGHQFNILDEQIDRYKVYQSRFPNFKIYYSIWRHSLRKIMQYDKSLLNLFEDLAHKTICGLVFPLRIIMAMHRSPNFQRYETDFWAHCTRVNSGILNLPLIDPGKFFDMLNLPDQFIIKKYLLPVDISICGFQIDSFPIIVIKDLRYRDWVDKWITKGEDIPF